MSLAVFLIALAAFLSFWWWVFDMDINASIDRDVRLRHRHDFQRIGYGGAGWSLYRCECGKTEIDA